MRIGTAVPTKYYKTVHKMGYDYIEFAGVEISKMSESDFNELVELVKETGLPVKGYNAYCGADVPIVGEGYKKELALEYAKLMCERGKLLGIESIGIGSPFARMLPEGYDTSLADKQAIEFTKVTAQVAKEYGIEVYFEAVHKYTCDFCNYTNHCEKLVDAVNMDNVNMILDFYHMEVMEEKVEKAVLAEKIEHLHISRLLDKYGRGYPTKKDDALLEEISLAVKSVNYKGSITIEAEEQYFEGDGEVGLEMMRKYF